MIISNYSDYKPKKLFIKKSNKYRGGQFREIRYNKKLFYIQTPCMLAPFGFNDFYDTIKLSLKDRDIDNKIEEFKNLIENIDNNIKKLIGKPPLNQNFIPSLALSTTDTLLFKIKVLSPNCKSYKTLFFDKDKKPTDKSIVQRNSYLSAIIELVGVWFNDFNYGLLWNAIQIQSSSEPLFNTFHISTECKPKHGFYNTHHTIELNPDQISLPSLSSLPPPPPPPLDLNKLNKPRKSIQQIIAENKGDTSFQLKKNSENENKIEPPSLNDILNGLSSLKRVKIDKRKRRKTVLTNPNDILMNELKTALKTKYQHNRTISEPNLLTIKNI